MRNYTAKIVITSLSIVMLVFATQTLAEPPQSQQLQEENTRLQQELADIEAQIKQYEQELAGVRGEKNTLANKLKGLQAQQAKVKLQIREVTLRIENITQDINDTKVEINTNEAHVVWLREQVGAVLREVYKHDQRSYVAALFSDGGLSAVSREVNNYKNLNQQLATIMSTLKAQTVQLAAYSEELASQREAQEHFVALIDLQNKELAGSITEQNTLLNETKGKESAYQAALSEQQKKAAQIRNRIYELFGTGNEVTFGEAVEIAQWVSVQTGVRAAFILAVLTQESSLGKNVGTCNRIGDPPEKSWKVVMKPERDQEPFKVITAELGLDIDTTPVSCPMRNKDGSQMGWGGAMGPAQFIPSTWLGYKDKVSAITGKFANPWDIRDAFVAAAVKLGADGATSIDGEWAAAMRYFSGSTNPKYSFYGDSVVERAEKYAADIAELNE